MQNGFLLTGGILSGLASILHLMCIAGGPSWYRFFGAGEPIAVLAERGSSKPILITLGIACVLGVWSLYAFSGAGYVRRLPLLRPVLVAITVTYLLRACALPLMVRAMPDRSVRFLLISSAVVLVYGLIYAVGVFRGWSELA